MREGIFVINQDDLAHSQKIAENSRLNLILRLKRSDLKRLAEILQSLSGKFKRLNLSLLDIEEFQNDDLMEYESQLEQIEKHAVEAYQHGQTVQMSFMTDRLLLKNMNNCDAGITHLTAGLDGRLYLCPGFYYQDAVNNAVGDMQHEVEISNEQLLELGSAPICSSCDAYHCKRCVYLNKKTTGEVNTPSHQQCVVSHLERNLSRRVSDTLRRRLEMFRKFTPLPEIPYLDPFEMLDDSLSGRMDRQERERLVAGLLAKPLEGIEPRELLYEIYRLDKNLLIQLKKRI
jgi:CXXX repeat peptide maturase